MDIRRRFLLLSIITLVGLSATATCLSEEDGPRIVSKALGGQPLSPAGVPVPSFGDTIRYDDGTLTFGLWLPGEDVYWAMRFTPAMDCTLKEAHCAIDIWSGQAPTCTLIVWDDNGGEPGTRVFSTTFTPDTTGLNVIDITSVITYPESTDFWIGYFLQAPAGLDTTLAGADSAVDYNERSGIGVSGVWYTMNDLGGDGDLIIRAFVEYYGHDVGTDSITGLPDTVRPESTYSPVAWVHNYGIHSENFLVECLINPGGYSDTFQVLSLAPAADTECVFKQWTVPPDDSTPYTMCVATLLASDADLSNDTLCKGTYAVNPVIHNAGVDSITSPPDTVWTGMDYSPVAWVHNYGGSSEYFLVICQIDSFGGVVYTDTNQVLNLAPGGDQEVGFTQWTVPPEQGVPYRTCVWTILIGDIDPSNDTLCMLSYAITGVAEELYVRRPRRLLLHTIVPNPFSVSTTIFYEIPVPGRVNVRIYDAAGRLVRTLVDDETSPGNHRTIWDGKGDDGPGVRDGVYFCKLSVGRLESTAKLILIK